MEPNLFTLPPASRRTDPESSHKAEKEITENSSRVSDCAEILNAMKHMPILAFSLETGVTAREVSNYLRERGIFIGRHDVDKRLNDLRHNGYVFSHPDYRKCTLSKRLCQVWWVNPERI